MLLRLRIPEVQDPDFTADVKLGTGDLPAELRLVGTADSGARAALAGFLVQLHDELRARIAREVIVDLKALEAMSAGCFNELVAWLTRLQDLPEVERYAIRFRLNRSVPWQSRTLRALSCFDTGLVTIEP